MPPNELESYAVMVVRAILGAKDLPADATDAQRGAAHRRQAEMLVDLLLYLMDHYAIAGYSVVTLTHAVMQGLRQYAREHLPKPKK